MSAESRFLEEPDTADTDAYADMLADRFEADADAHRKGEF